MRTDLAFQLEREMQGLDRDRRASLEAEARFGQHLLDIREGTLWAAAGRHSFAEFIKTDLCLSGATASKYISVAILYWPLIKQIRNLNPPVVLPPGWYSHLVALSAVPEEHRGTAWCAVWYRAKEEGKRITVDLINDVIYKHFLTPKIHKVKKLTPEEIRDYKSARAKIGSVCGDAILRQIDNGAIRVTQREVIVWARRSEEDILAISRAIEKLGWSVTKSIRELARTLTGDATVRDIAAHSVLRGKPIDMKWGPATMMAVPEGKI